MFTEELLWLRHSLFAIGHSHLVAFNVTILLHNYQGSLQIRLASLAQVWSKLVYSWADNSFNLFNGLEKKRSGVRVHICA